MGNIEIVERIVSMSKAAIIVPIYNVEKYVRKTIESAINQTEKDIEIILVDDGSKDSSGKICDEYAACDSRIKVIHKENGGLSSARNMGTQLAKSEYVMYLDGDDYLAVNSVERLLDIMKKYPCDFVQFRYEEVTDKQKVDEKVSDARIYQGQSSKELFENLYSLGGVAASGATKFVRRELMLEVPFVSIRHEDEMWCTHAFQKSLTVTYIPDVLYFYVMRHNSIIHSSFSENKLDIFKIIKERIDTLEKLKLDYLIHIEYERMFVSIVGLYCEAAKVNEKKALDSIKKQFMEYKSQIKKHANLQRKFKVLFHMMTLNYSFVKLYKSYVNRKSLEVAYNKEGNNT